MDPNKLNNLETNEMLDVISSRKYEVGLANLFTEKYTPQEALDRAVKFADFTIQNKKPYNVREGIYVSLLLETHINGFFNIVEFERNKFLNKELVRHLLTGQNPYSFDSSKYIQDANFSSYYENYPIAKSRQEAITFMKKTIDDGSCNLWKGIATLDVLVEYKTAYDNILHKPSSHSLDSITIEAPYFITNFLAEYDYESTDFFFPVENEENYSQIYDIHGMSLSFTSEANDGNNIVNQLEETSTILKRSEEDFELNFVEEKINEEKIINGIALTSEETKDGELGSGNSWLEHIL